MNAQTSINKSTLAPSIESMVDRFADLTQQLEFIEPLVKERDSLRKQLCEYADTQGNTAIKLQGHSHYVSLTPAPLMRNVNNIVGFLEAVGLDRFLTSIKISTTAADKLLTETQKAVLFDVTLGSRRIKDVGQLMPAEQSIQGSKLFNHLMGLSNPIR